MMSGSSPRGRLARRCAVALAFACALAPASAAAMSTPGGGELSPRLADLAEPGLRSAGADAQAEALSLAPSGPGSLLRDGGRVLAYVRFEAGAAGRAEELRSAGAEIVDVSSRYQTITVAAPPALLPALADVPGVAGVTEALAPLLRAANCAGAVRSEGDAQLGAARAREDFNVDGSGVTVGILSDSFDRRAAAVTHAGGDLASGDLPGPGSPCGSTPVGVLDDSVASGRDEGRAMAQIVHDLAPGAAIQFATAFSGELAFAGNVERLAGAGAKVIADDVAYLEEPFFQDGPVANAVAKVVGSGVSYFAAAGNENVIVGGRNVASWEAPGYRSSACPPALEAAVGAEQCMDFNPGGGTDSGFEVTVKGGGDLNVDLQWAEPWFGVATDLDAYLLDPVTHAPLEADDGGGGLEPVAAAGDNIASQKPVEVFKWTNPSPLPANVEIAIVRCSGACNPAASPILAPRLKFAFVQDSDVSATEYSQSSGGDVVGPTVFGHAGAAATIAVGAVRYSDASKPEAFSSRGPVKRFFAPVANTGPSPAIPPQEASKPDLVASDCVATTFFGQQDLSGVWRFCGTSAAAPHAAAVAALVREANPGASAAQVRTTLAATARPIPGFGPNDVGAGLLDADAAVAALALPPTVTLTKAPEALSRNRRPTIEFKANRPVVFSCAVDGAAPQICSSPYTLPYGVADGVHGVAVTAVDRAGRGGSSGVAGFRVDTRAPRTRIAKHPRKVVRIKRRKVRLSFRFRANESGVIFVCKVDRGFLRFCGSRFSRRFGVGRHVVTVRARDDAGNVDRTPSVFHFRVKQVGGR